MQIYLNPEAFKDKAIPPIKNKEHIINTTYAELKALVDNSQLIPGMQYRITDYVTTTTQENTQSANHPFDIIVIADKANKLNCKARAVQHEGDTYFNTSQLEKWELWYDIENNTDKYAWTDIDNGKGVIYRMIDEFNNDCPYDFKNIQFYRKWNADESLWSTISNDNTGVPCYTFSSGDYDITPSFTDYSLTSSNNVYFNVIKEYISDGKQRLNNNCFFGENCYSNTFGNNCTYNSFGNNCTYNSFGKNCYSNSFGNYCGSNTFGNDCGSNIFGNRCSRNTFGNDCYRIRFASDSSASIKYDYYRYNHFGDGCQYILFKGKETASSTQQVQDYNFAQGLQGTDSAYLTIGGVRNRPFETKVAKNSDGELKIYCEADLIK